MIETVRRAFQRWVDAQDVAASIAACEPKAWVGGTLGAFILVALAAFFPVTHQFTHLDARAAMLSYLPALACSTAMNLAKPSATTFRPLNWVILIFGVTALQFFAASLITWSQVPGAAVFSSIFIFTAGFHGHLHRVTLTEPFLAIGTLVASAAAAAMNRDPEHLAIFSVVIPAALSVELLAGSIASRGARDRAESERLRAAVDAQILEQQEREVRRLSQTLVEVLGANHDVNNSVMSAHLAAEELSGMCEQESLPPPHLVREVVTDLADSLVQIRSIVERVRATGTASHTPETEPVMIEPVLKAVIGNVAPRFPETAIVLDGIDGALSAGVRGGALSLRRVLHNLILNACEGDGTSRASLVKVSVLRDPSGAGVELIVSDNGPGFSAASLERPIEGFATSKKDGTGLGLYTTERLVRASGGSIERSNRPEGGARVRVTLPLEGSAPARERALSA